jgi:antitoxin component YwqK of YwqJK toxin-antitoxin module
MQATRDRFKGFGSAKSLKVLWLASICLAAIVVFMASAALVVALRTRDADGTPAKDEADRPTTVATEEPSTDKPVPFEQSFPSGQPRWRAALLRAGDGTLQLHGPSTEWYENKQRKTRGAYLYGKRTGSWSAWHEDGSPWVEAQFDKDRPVGEWTYFDRGGVVAGKRRDGKKFGPWRERDCAERTLGEGTYQDGRMHGPWSFRGLDGEVLMDVEYDAGTVHGKVTFHGPFPVTFRYDHGREVPSERCVRLGSEEYRGDHPEYGKLIRRTPSPAVEDLLWIPLDAPFDPPPVLDRHDFWPQGSRKTVVEYALLLEGQNAWQVRHGSAIGWYANGQQQDSQQYFSGLEHGVFRAWHSNGSPKYTIRYSHGLPVGAWEFWHANGAREACGDISLDGQCRNWHFWDEHGKSLTVDNISQWLDTKFH